MKKVLFVFLGFMAVSMFASTTNAGPRVSLFFGFGSPCSYHPYCGSYWGPCYAPIYYGAPVVYYTVPPVIYEPAPSVIYVQRQPAIPSPVLSASPSSTTEAAPLPDTSYFRMGRDWAQDLRNDVVTWNQFVAYLKGNSLESSPINFHEFRNGFLASYGVNASAAFDKALQQSHAGI